MFQGIILNFDKNIESCTFNVKKVPFLDLPFTIKDNQLIISPINFKFVSLKIEAINLMETIHLDSIKFDTGIENIIDYQSKNDLVLHDRSEEFKKINETHQKRNFLSSANKHFTNIIPCDLSTGDFLFLRIAKAMI